MCDEISTTICIGVPKRYPAFVVEQTYENGSRWVKMDRGYRCLNVLKGWSVADGDGLMVTVYGWLEYMITYLFTLKK